MTVAPLSDAMKVSTNGASPTEAEPTIVTIEHFAAVEEEGARALMGDGDNVLVGEASDVMLYGDGGAGKTTLTIDAACHLGSGKDWLGIPVARPARVLLIECEGPRPLLRKKLRRKLAAWDGPALDDRVLVLESPWSSFTFASEDWRHKLARDVAKQEIDVIIAGPLTRIGMDAAGTLNEVREFMALVRQVRDECGRLLTVFLVHHENKGGAVSGAWEGSGDTLLHVQAAGPGHTVVYVQKARWATEYHGQTLKLAWTDGEGFEVEGERDLLAEVLELLGDEEWRTIAEVAEGVKADKGAVRKLVETDRFVMRTGQDAKALGRSTRARLFQVAP